jgi:hypothetical protein
MTSVLVEPAEIVQTRTSALAGRLRPYALVLLAVLTGFGVEHALRPVPAFLYDDPYITLHSAQVMHTGFDLNYPGVAPLFGVTSAPFAGLVYLLLFVLPPLLALDVACWLGILFYAFGLIYLADVLELRRYQQRLLVFLGLVSAPVPIHLLNGLETSCALAAVTWTLGLASGRRPRWLTAAFLAGLSASLRPDLLPLAFLVIVTLGWQVVRLNPKQTNRWIRALAMLIAGAVPIAICGLCYYHQTGSPIPLTGAAKRYFFAEDHWPIMRRLTSEAVGIFLFFVALGPLVVALAGMLRFTLGKALLLTLLLFAAAMFIQFPAQLGFHEFRYLVVLVPVPIWGLGMMLKHDRGDRNRQAEQLMYAGSVYAVLMLPICARYYQTERIFFDAGPREVASWCEKNLAPRTTVLVHDAGYLAYSTSFRTVDFVGLKTPSAIALNRRYTWPSAGRDRARTVSEIAAQSGASYLVINLNWAPVRTLAEELRGIGWRVELLHSAGTFQIFRITPPV